MQSFSVGTILVTGASGHVGRAVCAQLRGAGKRLLATDIEGDAHETDFAPCDLRHGDEVARLFHAHPIRSVIHLAAVLPSAYQADPLAGAALNLTGSLNLLREAIKHSVKRFVFASSVSVYGLSGRTCRAFTEDDPTAPDEPYGASKRAMETIGEGLHSSGAIEFVALRIARVIGPGIKKTSSPWRAQMFEAVPQTAAISLPYAPDAELCLVHVEDVARMLILLVETSAMQHCIYNSPSEIWNARQLKAVIEQAKGVRVELGREGAYAGATCDGNRFALEFGLRLRGVSERLGYKES
jgi:nucleoside-diphosphate-sugar epimerase